MLEPVQTHLKQRPLARLAQRCCACLAAMLIAGCSTVREYPPVNLSPSDRLVDVGGAASSAEIRRVAGLQTEVGGQRNVLVLSCGADFGAYTAGVLNGWTALGTRPSFDVVTGVSTGALIAPLAFLGPQYDKVMARGYTEARASDVYRRRSLPTLLWSDSLADSAPLRRRIEREVTPELLARIAAAHAEGRRLYVGTTNLDTKRLVVWDMGAIAAGSDPDKLNVFRSVLLASASVPGFLPPVPINVTVDGRPCTELHVDGGVSTSLLLQPAMLGMEPDGQRHQETANQVSVHVIVAGKLRPAPRPVERRLLAVVEESLRGTLQARFEGDLQKVCLLARRARADIGLTAVPDDFSEQGDGGMSFNPRVMQELFERGYRYGARALESRSLPPELIQLKEHVTPRTGVTFTVSRDALDAP